MGEVHNLFDENKPVATLLTSAQALMPHIITALKRYDKLKEEGK